MTQPPTPMSPADMLRAYLERERQMALMRLAELDRLLGRPPTVQTKAERERLAFARRHGEPGDRP